jgi:hypothetical protein
MTDFGMKQRRVVFTLSGVEYDYPCTDLRWRVLTRIDEKEAFNILKNSEVIQMTVGLGRWHLEQYWPLVLSIHTHPLFEVEIDYGTL